MSIEDVLEAQAVATATRNRSKRAQEGVEGLKRLAIWFKSVQRPKALESKEKRVLA
jgi:hypothetical protein